MSLPQVCCRCQKLKTVDLGVIQRSRTKFAKKVFVCFSCLDKPKVHRWGRYEHPATPVEKKAKESLELLVAEGWFIVAEYTLKKKFIYDFAVPKLRLLIEIDSHSYHSKHYQKSRDKRKTQWAAQHGWELKRFRPSESMGSDIFKAVKARAAELGF